MSLVGLAHTTHSLLSKAKTKTNKQNKKKTTHINPGMIVHFLPLHTLCHSCTTYRQTVVASSTPIMCSSPLGGMVTNGGEEERTRI